MSEREQLNAIIDARIATAMRDAPFRGVRLPKVELPEVLGIFAGTITAVTGSTNATYDAVADANSNFSVTAATPLDRPVLVSDGATYTAKSVGNPCILIHNSSGTTILANVWETLTTTACPAS